MTKILSKTYSPQDPEKLIRYETEDYVASLQTANDREEWIRWNKKTGELERLDYDLITGEQKWVKQLSGIIFESGIEENITIDVDLTVEKYELPDDEDPVDKIMKAKEQIL